MNVAGNITTSKTLDVTGSVSAANLTNEGSVSVGGTLTASGDVSNTNTITVVGKVIVEDVTNSGILTFGNGAEINDFVNNGSAYITGSTIANNITNNEEKYSILPVMLLLKILPIKVIWISQEMPQQKC